MSTISSNPRKELADQYLAQKSEKEALKDQHETEVEQLKKSYSSEKAALEDRFEQSVQGEKIAHYDQLRNTKRQMQNEERRLESQRSQIVGTAREDLNKEALKTEQEGRSKVDSLKTKYAAAEEYERNRATAAQQEVNTHHRKSAENILSDSEQKIKTLREQKEAELVLQKETNHEAVGQIREHYDGLRGSTQNQYAASLKDLDQRATDDLDQRRLASMVFINNYANRKTDPFYNMKRFESQLEDKGDAYTLRVKVPAYERDQFKVQVNGQEIQLSGVRSNNERVEVEPGRWVSSNAYENLNERISLDFPVDAKSMTLRNQGDWVEYTIPKFGPGRRVNDQYKPSALVNMDRDDKALVKELEFVKTLPKPTLKS